MAAENVYLVPTLVTYHRVVERVTAHPDLFSFEIREGVVEIASALGTCVRLARDAGVAIALGSDFAQRKTTGLTSPRSPTCIARACRSRTRYSRRH